MRISKKVSSLFSKVAWYEKSTDLWSGFNRREH